MQSLTKVFQNQQAPSKAEFERKLSDSYRAVFSLAMRLTGNSTDAEDLVQEAYIRAYRFFDRYDPSLSFTSWMYRILSNVHIDQVRRKSKFKLSSLEHGGTDGETSWDVADDTLSPDRIICEPVLDDALQYGLLSMSHEFRLAVVLADVEGMAYEEIADVMNTSVGTVRSRIHRGRKQLRSYLEREFPGRFTTTGAAR